ncbi:MAG: 1-deoxy-D-xylulose-5-phosphate reductoisomerase, partial [Spirochaetaceae bacterium]|nr:1-deoxy-D-xylulose-5-phosphate reductoisomerase [Spirochaetaceae bacterium]
LALANKETIVMAGPLVLDLAAKQGRKVIPVDSEHSAVFHLLRRSSAEAAEIILTASGGPFRTLDKAKFTEIRAADALKHPTWNMGAKITIDSATLANKGLEVIEARYLFGMEPDKIKVLVHPQSIVHSLIRTVDGVLYAQLSRPDMRHPLMNALLFPETVSNDLEILDLAGQELTFFPPRFDDFPLLGLAYRAAEAGLGSCIAYNAANEIAVQAFLQGRIRFTDFASLVGAALDAAATDRPETIGEVLALDAKYRSVTV